MSALVKVTISASLWAVLTGKATQGGTQTMYFEPEDEQAIEEFASSGVLIDKSLVTADEDEWMFTHSF